MYSEFTIPENVDYLSISNMYRMSLITESYKLRDNESMQLEYENTHKIERNYNYD